MSKNYKAHWETVYETKSPNEVSWTQAKPKTSIDLINSFNLPKSSSIIDVGGGDSLLVDFLLEDGYENITVLDISSKAIARAKKRLGAKAKKVKWIVSNVTDYMPSDSFDVWHDRATLHFLNDFNEINKYVGLVKKSVNKNLVIATFSDEGPLKCSGIEIVQYTAEKMGNLFNDCFEKIDSFKQNHTTPFNTKQNFIFCSFMKKSTP